MVPIQTTLLVDHSEIVKGLGNGILQRYGGVVRWAKGTPKGGQIVTHLAEVPTATLNPPNLSPNLSRLMGLTQVAAGASVLNLGVSVIGFAYMGYKLHQIQKSLGQLQQTVNAALQSLDAVHSKLEAIAGQLRCLCWLVQDNRCQQENLVRAIANVQKTFVMQSISELQAHLNYFAARAWRETAMCAAKTRLFLSSQVLPVSPELDAEWMLSTDAALQGWAVATEAQILLQVGEHQKARQLLMAEVPQFQQAAQQWCGALLRDEANPVLDSAYLFATKPFVGAIAPERVQRIATISLADQRLHPDEKRWRQHELAVEFEMSYANQRYPAAWVNQKRAIAEYLDTLSELTARLDTLQAFAELCEAAGGRSSQALLPPENAAPGLYLLTRSC